jgi:hypothetical protein
MPVRFLKNASEIADVSWETPLPVLETDKERKLVQADPLLLTSTTVDTTAKDLFANTATELATIANAGQYHTLVWTCFKTFTTDISYTIQARTTDLDGNPLGSGWITVATGTITGAANSWNRVDITATNGLYYDQYRITVSQASGSQTLYSKVVGVRR